MKIVTAIFIILIFSTPVLAQYWPALQQSPPAPQQPTSDGKDVDDIPVIVVGD